MYVAVFMFVRFWKTVVRAMLSIITMTFCTSCGSFWDKIQAVANGYQNKFDYPGAWEKKYAYDGDYQVELFTQEDSDERITSNIPESFNVLKRSSGLV